MRVLKLIARLLKYVLYFILLLSFAFWVNDNIFFPNQKTTVTYKDDTK